MEKRTEKKASNFYVFLGIIFATILVFIAACYLTQLHKFKAKDTIVRWGYAYDLSFVVKDDGKVVDDDAVVPFKYDTAGVTTLSTVLPDDLPEDAVFCFLSGMESDVYIDGQLRFTDHFEDKPIRGSVVKSILMQVPLSDADAGKTLTIVRGGDEDFKGTIRKAYIGNSLGIYECLFAEYGMLFYLAITVALFAAAFAVCGLVYWLLKGESWEIFLIGVAFLLPSLWVICDNTLFQVAFHAFYVEGVIEYMLGVLAPLPFVFYLNIQQERRYERFVCFLVVFDFIVLTIISSLHFGEIASLSETMPFMGTAIALVVAGAMSTILVDIKKGLEIKYKTFVLGLMILGISSIIDVVMMVVDDKWLDTSAVMVGLIVLFICTVLDTIFSGIRKKEEAEEISAANSMKSAFLANLASELQEPVELIISSQNKLIYDGLDDEERPFYSAQIKAATDRLQELTEDIMNFTKAVPDELELTEEKYDFYKILENITATTKRKCQEAGLDCQIKINDMLPMQLWGDADKLQQVVITMVENACRHTEMGYVKLDISMDKYNKASNTLNLVITVTDTGQGSREDEADLIPLLHGSYNTSVNSGFTEVVATIPQSIIDATPVGNRHKEKSATAHQLTILDRESAKEYCLGDKGVYAIMADTFASEAESKQATLEQLMETENFREYQLLIQGLKTSAKQIGALALYWACQEMDVACKEKRYDYAFDHHKRLMEIYKNTIEVIESGDY